MNFDNHIPVDFFNISSEAEHVLGVSLFLGKSSLSTLIMCVLIRKAQYTWLRQGLTDIEITTL